MSTLIKFPEEFKFVSKSVTGAFGYGVHPTEQESLIDTKELNELGSSLMVQGKLNEKAAAFTGLSVLFLSVSTLITYLK